MGDERPQVSHVLLQLTNDSVLSHPHSIVHQTFCVGTYSEGLGIDVRHLASTFTIRWRSDVAIKIDTLMVCVVMCAVAIIETCGKIFLLQCIVKCHTEYLKSSFHLGKFLSAATSSERSNQS